MIVSMDPRSVSSWVRFAERGPNGETMVALRDSDATTLRSFDPRSLDEVAGAPRRLEGSISSVRLGADGASLLWASGGVLSHQAADGPLRSTGPGIAAAWFIGG